MSTRFLTLLAMQIELKTMDTHFHKPNQTAGLLFRETDDLIVDDERPLYWDQKENRPSNSMGKWSNEEMVCTQTPAYTALWKVDNS